MTFLTSFFENLNSTGIFYSVLRNSDNLPYSTNGSDLDILINKSDKVIFYKLLIDIAGRYNGNIVSFINSNSCPRICVLGYKDLPWGIMIDLHYDLIGYRGHTLFTNKIIVKNTFLNNNNISVLDDKIISLNGIFKELLNNGICDVKYFKSFKTSLLDNVFLKNVFNEINKPALVNVISNFKEISYSEQSMKNYSKVLKLSFPKKKIEPLDLLVKLSRLLKQPGFTIAFLGTDGSGKTSIIENIKPFLSDSFHNSVYYEHMRPNKFPSIAKLFGKKEEFTETVSNPHGSSSSGFFGSLARWLYYLLDYTFGFYLKVWSKKSIKSCVWIFDRYYYDFLIDPKRARMKLPKIIFKLGQFLIPEPDLILCLGSEGHVIHKRKPELTLEEVNRQIYELKNFSQSHNRAVWIDTGKDIETSSKDAIDAITNMMGKRFMNVNFLT